MQALYTIAQAGELRSLGVPIVERPHAAQAGSKIIEIFLTGEVICVQASSVIDDPAVHFLLCGSTAENVTATTSA